MNNIISSAKKEIIATQAFIEKIQELFVRLKEKEDAVLAQKICESESIFLEYAKLQENANELICRIKLLEILAWKIINKNNGKLPAHKKRAAIFFSIKTEEQIKRYIEEEPDARTAYTVYMRVKRKEEQEIMAATSPKEQVLISDDERERVLFDALNRYENKGAPFSVETLWMDVARYCNISYEECRLSIRKRKITIGNIENVPSFVGLKSANNTWEQFPFLSLRVSQLQELILYREEQEKADRLATNTLKKVLEKTDIKRRDAPIYIFLYKGDNTV